MNEHAELEHQLALLEARIDYFRALICCPGRGGLQDVETFQTKGSGIGAVLVAKLHPAVGLLEWLDKTILQSRFPDPGSVGGEFWASGVLLDKDRFLTAGHCFYKEGGGFTFPKNADGTIIKKGDAARAMQVRFGREVDGSNKSGQAPPRLGETFPVEGLLDGGDLDGVDFAILQLGKNSAKESPSAKYPALKVATKDLMTPGANLCIIQYPEIGGFVKMVATGTLDHSNGVVMAYKTVDTDQGSSGSPIFSDQGEIVGVHVEGDCSVGNLGTAIGEIERVTKWLP